MVTISLFIQSRVNIVPFFLLELITIINKRDLLLFRPIINGNEVHSNNRNNKNDLLQGGQTGSSSTDYVNNTIDPSGQVRVTN